jgi:hypothetical protein
LGFPKLHVEVWFFVVFFILFRCWQFSLTFTTMIVYCPHKASGEGGLVQSWTTNQPYLLATRVLERPQSFTSFLVIHFYFAYFLVWLFR